LKGNISISEQIGVLKSEIVQKQYLPSLNFNAQLTYLSDVIDLDPIFANFPATIPAPDIDPLPHGQYKFYLDARQLIYDGGITKNLMLLENESAKSEVQKVLIDMYAIKDKVNQQYFGILLSQQNIGIIELYLENLTEKIAVIETAKKNGIVMQSDVDNLLAEKLKLEQQLIELKYVRESLVSSINTLIGYEKNRNIILTNSLFAELQPGEIKRPEIDLFSIEKNRLELTQDLTKSMRYPKLAGFGQFGAGQPGLNMLNPDLASYTIVGLNLSWEIWDWEKTKKNRQIINMSHTIIENKELAFKQSINILSDVEFKKIEKYNALIQKDNEVIELKSRISANASSKVNNGTMTSHDYLSILNEEKNAKINKALHQIELERAKVNLLTLRGRKK
ncbi:MAG: TolC family protein, partial [Bacteroidales bacterium]|nr:TolC family protein [Bacteroidales bacterium]